MLMYMLGGSRGRGEVTNHTITQSEIMLSNIHSNKYCVKWERYQQKRNL